MPKRRRTTTTASPTKDDHLFRLFIERVKDYAVFMLDPEGHVLTWNAGAELVKGYRAKEIIGQSFARFYTEEDRRNGRPSYLLGLAARDGRVEDEGWRVRKDGSLFWADVVITAMYDEDGEIQGFAKITRDLTERRRAEEELRKAHQDLEQRVAERTRELEAANAALFEKNLDLEKFSEVVVGRELKAIELERRIRELEELVSALRADAKKRLADPA